MIYFSVNKLYVFEKLIFLASKRCIAFPITLNYLSEKKQQQKKKKKPFFFAMTDFARLSVRRQPGKRV